MSFLETGLDETLCIRLQALGYEHPTDIQKLVVPAALNGSDILATAQTGTGKTAAFLLPLLSIMTSKAARHRLPRLLILEPTRELAYQVMEEACHLFPALKDHIGVFVGGESPVKQEKVLHRGVDIVVATPGRLLDLIERQKILLHQAKYAVVDEVDRMLDMGFLDDVDRILATLKQRHQTLMLSATLDATIEKLAERYMLKPKRFEAHQNNSTADTISQYSVSASPNKKVPTLLSLLAQEWKDEPTIIFCNRKRDIPALVGRLQKEKLACEALHGDMHQNDRSATLQRFKQGAIKILVATDVAARGLDVEGLSVVINWDVPISGEDYIHRIGRSGRAGQQGRAYTLLTPAEAERWSTINTEGRVQSLTMNPAPPKTQKTDVASPSKGTHGFGAHTPAFFSIPIPRRSDV